MFLGANLTRLSERKKSIEATSHLLRHWPRNPIELRNLPIASIKKALVSLFAFKPFPSFPSDSANGPCAAQLDATDSLPVSPDTYCDSDLHSFPILDEPTCSPLGEGRIAQFSTHRTPSRHWQFWVCRRKIGQQHSGNGHHQTPFRNRRLRQ